MVLSSDSPCSGCKQNCCDPVPLVGLFIRGRHAVLGVPLNADDPKQFPVPEEILESARQYILDRLRERIERALAVTPDGRFSFKGIALVRTGHLFNADLEGPLAKKFKARMAVIDTRLLMNCDAYDRINKACSHYETRPNSCRNVDIKTCGLSRISKPALGPGGIVRTTNELAEEQLRMNAPAQQTPEAAMRDLIDLMRSEY